jgi:hypothetical protein
LGDKGRIRLGADKPTNPIGNPQKPALDRRCRRAATSIRRHPSQSRVLFSQQGGSSEPIACLNPRRGAVRHWQRGRHIAGRFPEADTAGPLSNRRPLAADAPPARGISPPRIPVSMARHHSSSLGRLADLFFVRKRTILASPAERDAPSYVDSYRFAPRNLFILAAIRRALCRTQLMGYGLT